MHRERKGTHRNAQVHTEVHGSEWESCIMSNKLHRKRPINARMSTQLPSAVVVSAVLFFVLLLQRLFE